MLLLRDCSVDLHFLLTQKLKESTKKPCYIFLYQIDAQKKICISNKEDLQKFVDLLKSDISDEKIVNIVS